MINPQWLKLPMSQTIFYGPQDIRAIEVQLYYRHYKCKQWTLCFKGQPLDFISKNVYKMGIFS